jgi:hypothetical protein
MADTEKINRLKTILRESDIPFFSDGELAEQLDRAGGDINLAVYYCAIIKAENSAITVSGLSVADSADYWLRLAASYRPSMTTIAG